MKKQKGFTLIELMIVVAIIGVLSAIAIPAYKNYVTKSEVASAMSTMKALITPFEAHLQENGVENVPSLEEIGTNTNANPLGTITEPEITSGIIKFVFKFGSKSSIDEQTVLFSKNTTADASIWECYHEIQDVKIKGCITSELPARPTPTTP